MPRDPAARTYPVEDQVTGNFRQEIAEEKQAGSELLTAICALVAGHDRRLERIPTRS